MDFGMTGCWYSGKNLLETCHDSASGYTYQSVFNMCSSASIPGTDFLAIYRKS